MLTLADLAPFRIRVSAAIVKDGEILLIECDEPGFGPHYNLPGGGVDDGEMLFEALKREVIEETCAKIEVSSLLLVSEHQMPHPHDPSRKRLSLHLLFRCHLLPGETPRMPSQPDIYQTNVLWMPISELSNCRLLPNYGNKIASAINCGCDCYSDVS